MKYDHTSIEEKWMKVWQDEQLFQGIDQQVAPDSAKHLYLLFAFAYPSGEGLHVGHVESKTALDILARYYRMMGNRVFFPVGWDAFGLPAENYAIKTGVPPAETTRKAIETFRAQIKRLGISYAWDSELATSHPGYYKWTQWLFLQLFEKGLAYKKPGRVNWCPSCQTVLANEQVIQIQRKTDPSTAKHLTGALPAQDDTLDLESLSSVSSTEMVGVCERCETPVIQKELEQWYFRITDYTEELISGLEQVDWPEPTKRQQLEWIGRSEGIQITFEVIKPKITIDVFTTAPTNWGASFLVVAPEHDAVGKIVTQEQQKEVDKYLETIRSKSESQRAKSTEKTGVFTGAYAINHVTGEKIPIWISDFVLAHVGTGAIQACPGHDKRDFEFAKQFGLPIPRVVVGPDGDTSPIEGVEQVIDKTMPGKMINSDFLDGIEYADALQKTMNYFEKQGWGKRVVTYKLRDWLISRQRYWGAPIPIVYDPEGKAHPVKEAHLPWMLPTDVEFKPTGESPLVNSKELKERVERLYGKGWTPEYDTMDTFVDSSWYFLRYPSVQSQKSKVKRDPSTVEQSALARRAQDDKSDLKSVSDLSNTEKVVLGWDRDWTKDGELPFDPELTRQWLPVDMYMIGPEHIVLHLLYARFITKFLRDQGYLNFDEPFMKMRHQGMILGPDHRKMSKSKGNVINPEPIISEFGADTLRVYEMFMGPLDADKPWDPHSVRGVYRFITRIHRLVLEAETLKARTNLDLRKQLHRTIRKVSEDVPRLKFNTAIASLMEFVNEWERARLADPRETLSGGDSGWFLRLIAPFMPYLAEELWMMRGSDMSSVHYQDWPVWDKAEVASEFSTVVVQINGRKRATLVVSSQQSGFREENVNKMALEDGRVAKWLEGKEIVKTIWITPSDKGQGLLNFVVK